MRPIINVQPSYDSVYTALEQIVLHSDQIPELKRQSIEYVKKYHDYLHVAKQYEDLYHGILSGQEKKRKRILSPVQTLQLPLEELSKYLPSR